MKNITHSQTIIQVIDIDFEVLRMSASSGGALAITIENITGGTFIEEGYIQFDNTQELDVNIQPSHFRDIIHSNTSYSVKMNYQLHKQPGKFQYAQITTTMLFSIMVTDEGLTFDIYPILLTLLNALLNFYWIGLIVSLFSFKWSFYVANLLAIVTLLLEGDLSLFIVFVLQIFLIGAEHKDNEVDRN
jgi:hypothetical protein